MSLTEKSNTQSQLFRKVKGKMPNLSDRQRKILEYIMSVLSDRSIPPTIREIGKAVEISSTSVVNYNLAKLQEFELLDREKDVSRGLTLNWEKLATLGLTNGYNEPQHGAPSLVENALGGLVQVPVLGKIAAGIPIQVNPDTPATTDNWVSIAEGMFGSTEELFALEVQGDSMVDASVLDGDIVILRHQQTADNGDMVAAWIEDEEETTLKFLHKEGRKIRLEPANPNYDPIYKDADQVRIDGKVVSVIRVYQKM